MQLGWGISAAAGRAPRCAGRGLVRGRTLANAWAPGWGPSRWMEALEAAGFGAERPWKGLRGLWVDGPHLVRIDWLELRVSVRDTEMRRHSC